MIQQRKILSVSLVALFLVLPIAGCLDKQTEDKISANDVKISPEVMIAGKFQPLVITAKKDISVFIPNLVIDPISNYVQNGTVLDMKTGETKQLISLAPPRINSAFVFLAEYGNLNWPIRSPSESWESWVDRGGFNDKEWAVTRVDPDEGASLDTLNRTSENSADVVPIRISV
ncbi:uncharacterized protein METZ01_LOCUS455179, partial [marine metagenome]